MQFARTLLLGLALASAATSRADDAAGPSVGHPLSPLCDLVCGGVWRPAAPISPDQFYTIMTFAWDAASGTIRGTSTRQGGIVGIRQVTTVTFAYDETTDAITVTRAPDESRWKPASSEIPSPVSGVITLSGTGFQTRIDGPAPGEMMLTAILFETPDLWVERSEIIANGQAILGAENRYARKNQ